MKSIQFETILSPKKVVLEVPTDEVPDDLLNKEDMSYCYADERIRVDGKAVRLKLIEEKEGNL